MNQPHIPRFSSRREFLFKASGGFGALALANLLQAEPPGANASGSPISGSPLAAKATHHPAKAKSVIFLFMEGGPSHLDTFDPKPDLVKLQGQKLPKSFGTVVTPMGTGGNNLMPSKRTFTKHGKSGIEVCDWLPHIAGRADDIAVLRSCWADGLNHVGSVCQMNTGNILAGRPSLGSWVLYGLGSVSQNLPGFVVMSDGGEPAGGARNWGTAFMSSTYQGTPLRSGASPVLHLSPSPEISGDQQRNKLDLINALNQKHLQGRAADSDLAARINAYELAFRMQAAAPEAVDLSKESDKVKEMYGLNVKECADYGLRCLMARRLVERGVRFVQVYCGGGSQWDAHSDIEGNHQKMCLRTDQPTAALLKDLKQRGLLDSTLVVWGGEFGRTPMSEGSKGRDHNPYGFSMWFAGGGIKPGQVIGSTDEIGLRAVDDRSHVHDIHATILHQLGLDHRKLTWFHNGRDERLTENGGKLIDKLVG